MTKIEPTLQLTIAGEDGIGGPTPETLPVEELARFLTLLQAAIKASVGADKAAASPLSLQAIGDGSVELNFAGAGESVPQVVASLKDKSSAAVANPDEYIAWKQLSDHVANKKWNVNLKSSSSQATLSASEPIVELKPSKKRIKIYGRCIRVGGVDPKVQIEVRSGYRVSFRVQAKEIKSFAERLYTVVGVVGTGNLHPLTRKVFNFKFGKLLSYKPKSGNEVLRRLRERAKGKVQREAIGELFRDDD